MKSLVTLAVLACTGGMPFTCCGPNRHAAALLPPDAAICCPDDAVRQAKEEIDGNGLKPKQYRPFEAVLEGTTWVVTGGRDQADSPSIVVRLDALTGTGELKEIAQ